MLCGSLDEREVWGRIETCMCVAESLLYVHLKLSQHCYSAVPQYKVKIDNNKKTLHASTAGA